MVLVCGGFERSLGHEGGVHINVVSVFIKEVPHCFLEPSAMWGHK